MVFLWLAKFLNELMLLPFFYYLMDFNFWKSKRVRNTLNYVNLEMFAEEGDTMNLEKQAANLRDSLLEESLEGNVNSSN